MDVVDVSRGVECFRISVDPPDSLPDVSDFVYVRCNIPGPEYSKQEFKEQFQGCLCSQEESCSSGCPCLGQHGVSYSNGTLVIENPGSSIQKPILECNKMCECSQQCENRVVQHGIQVPLTVFQTAKKGYGLRTDCDLNAHTFICEYAGEVISEEMARKRTLAFSKTPNHLLGNYYIMVLREHLGNGDVLMTYIDPAFIGNVGRFINHSCEPNLYMVPVRVDNNIPRLALFSRHDILAGEELTYNYSGLFNQDTDMDIVVEEIEQMSGETKLQKKVCYCGSSQCRGYLPFDDTLFAEDK